MALAPRTARLAGAFAVAAAFLWASYFFFVLGVTPRVAPSALLSYPFLVGGAAYFVWALRQGHAGEYRRLLTDWTAYGRIALLVGMQLSVLGSTFAAGAVDTSLLSLLGDVVLTPVLLILLFSEGRGRARSLTFAGGLILSVAGASLTIAGGGGAQPIHGIAWVVALLVPITVAFYFLASARANLRTPSSVVIGHASLGGGLVGLALSPWLPGGVAGLAVPNPVDLALVAALGLTSFFVAPVLYFTAIEKAGLMLPALLMATIPVFTLVLSALVFRSVPPLLAVLGIPVAVAGAALALQGGHLPWAPGYRSAERASP